MYAEQSNLLQTLSSVLLPGPPEEYESTTERGSSMRENGLHEYQIDKTDIYQRQA